jgi:two-component system LytT family response regulator
MIKATIQTQTIKTVIADDEPLARERIKGLMSGDLELEMVQECRNGRETLQTLLTQEIDLLMLDIHMPGLSGFEVVKGMGARKLPMIIFVTAHDSYAIQAFEVHAVDYLIKPVDPARFQEAIKRVKERKQMHTALAAQEKLSSVLTSLQLWAATDNTRPTRFVVHSGSKDLFVNTCDIAWIEAADYYVSLHVADKRHLLRESIKKLETQLDPRKFIRIHRSAIVNIEYVREIHREGRSEGWVLLANGDRVRMSSAGWQKLLAAGRS